MYSLLNNLIIYLTSLILATCICMSIISCHPGQHNTSAQKYEHADVERQRGAHIFGGLDTTSLQELKENNIEWITLVPFAGQADYDAPTLRYNRSNSPEDIENRNRRWVDQMKLSKDLGFKVFLKPHIWMHAPRDGKWRSDIYPSNEENWKTWSDDYRAFILNYARLAQEAHADMFCIGTELTRLSSEKPEFWKGLIREVKNIYSGQLTYAANWYEEYESVSFWEELDFIGIQAYFPLTKNMEPSVLELKKAWDGIMPELSKVSQANQRPILFTEVGYKSSANAAIEPWAWIDYGGDDDLEQSDKTQANCYQAVFETLWRQEWFAGMHVWQWRSDHRDRRGKNHIDFTPQGKKAQEIISEGYAK